MSANVQSTAREKVSLKVALPVVIQHLWVYANMSVELQGRVDLLVNC